MTSFSSNNQLLWKTAINKKYFAKMSLSLKVCKIIKWFFILFATNSCGESTKIIFYEINISFLLNKQENFILDGNCEPMVTSAMTIQKS